MYIAATPNPRATEIRGAGDPHPLGANPVVNPWEAQALLAPARQLTPQADEREDLRVAHLILPSVAALALAAAPSAVASGAATSPSGGGSSPSGGVTTSTTPTTNSTTSTTTSTTSTGSTANSGGVGVGAGPAPLSTVAHPIVSGSFAEIKNGVAYAPAYAPVAVQQAIWAGNLIRTKPYIWGGGHAAFAARGYDCSGSVSFVLHAAGLLKTPFDSSDFMHWGQHGVGRWITVYTNPGHAFIEVAGVRFDTSGEADPHPAKGSGPRWRPLFLNPSGFTARHPLGF
jgi:hypothetical protein